MLETQSVGWYSEKIERGGAAYSSKGQPNFEPVGYLKILRIPKAFFALMSIMISMNLFTFVDTVLADNLTKEFGLSSS